MTPVPDPAERDAELSAAWRKHSAETPPARLDAAVLAAAHRAVGSAPSDAGKPAAEATSPQRWWMPLAAAATIGAVALGILQTMPAESPVTAPSVSDMPSRTTDRAPSLPSLPRDELAATQRASAPRAAAESAIPAMPAMSESREVAKSATPAVPPSRQAAKATAPYATDNAAAPPAPAAAPPQPFPAERKSEATETADSKDRARVAPALAAAPVVAQSAEPARAEMRRQSETAAAAPAASGTVRMAKAVASVDAASAPAVDIAAWIIRIRKLHDDGKLADAAKELVALRAAIPDADGRLPPELRAWAATVKP
jgi:resuscitation-promoting factor RpfA